MEYDIDLVTGPERDYYFDKYEKLYNFFINPLSSCFRIMNPENIIKDEALLVGTTHPALLEITSLVKIFKRAYFVSRKEASRVKSLSELANQFIEKPIRVMGKSIKSILPYLFNKAILKPFFSYITQSVPNKLIKIGTPFFDISKNSNKKTYNTNTSNYIVELMKRDKTVVILQFNSKNKRSKHHPYLNRFGLGLGGAAFDLYLKGYNVPITLVTFKGCEKLPFLSSERPVAYIHEPFYFKDFVREYELPSKILNENNKKSIAYRFGDYSEMKCADVLVNKLGVPIDIYNSKK